MSRRRYTLVLSELAELDLADILQYTLETWDVAQMDVYAEKLEYGMRLLETQPHLGKPREDWFPGCRCHQVEYHLVLYQVVGSEIQVARLFHERMDPARHFKN